MACVVIVKERARHGRALQLRFVDFLSTIQDAWHLSLKLKVDNPNESPYQQIVDIFLLSFGYRATGTAL